MERKVRSKSDNGSNRNPTLYETMEDFSQQTSLHGVKYVMQETVWKPRRILWAAVVVAQLVGLGIVMGNQLLHVGSKPLLTKVVTRYVDELAFPAVTICKTLPNWTHEGLSDFENQVVKNEANRSFFTSLPSEDYAKINFQDIYRKRLALDKDFVSACMFGYQTCMHHVQKRLMSETICYTINSVLPEDTPVSRDTKEPLTNPKILSRLISRGEGEVGGMFVGLKLSSAKEEAVKLILHQSDEKIVMMNSEFLSFTPGKIYYLGLSVQKAFGDEECMRIPTDYRRGDLRRGRYTLRACHDSCRVQNVENYCGCSMWFGARNQCDPLKRLDCELRLMKLSQNSSFNLHKVDSCHCPFPCDDMEYRTTLSSGPLMRPESHSLELQIYFDRLKTVSTEQVPDYTGGDVFASLGGQMGLFLGASIITLAELADLIIRCTCGRIFRRTKSSDRKDYL